METHRRGDDGVPGEIVGEENTIEARGPGIEGGRVACDMVAGVSMETELGFEMKKEGGEGW